MIWLEFCYDYDKINVRLLFEGVIAICRFNCVVKKSIPITFLNVLISKYNITYIIARFKLTPYQISSKSLQPFNPEGLTDRQKDR